MDNLLLNEQREEIFKDRIKRIERANFMTDVWQRLYTFRMTDHTKYDGTMSYLLNTEIRRIESEMNTYHTY